MAWYRSLPEYDQADEYSFYISDFKGGVNMNEDDQNMSLSESPLAYNVSGKDGSLKRCEGYGRAYKHEDMLNKELIIPELPTPGSGRLLVYRVNTETQPREHLAYVNDLGLYKCILDGFDLKWQLINTVDFSTVEYSVNYRKDSGDCLVFGPGVENNNIYLWSHFSQPPSPVEGTPKLSSAVVHYERMFGVGDPDHVNRIWFSAQFDPTDFTVSLDAGGYIDVMGDKGRALRVLSFSDSIFVFWQYGITRVKAYNYQSEFTVSDIYSCDSEILKNSVCLCGDQIIFAAKDGIYSFDGYSVQRISDKITGIINEGLNASGECSAYFRGKYYLAVPSSYLSEVEGHLMLEYDTSSNKWRIFKGQAIRQLLVYHDEGRERLLLIGNNYVYEMDGSQTFGGMPISARWDMPMSNLGKPHLIKNIRELLITAQGEGLLRLRMITESAEIERTIRLRDTRRVYKVPVRISGKLVQLSIENVSGNNFTVSNPMVIYTVLRG